MKCRRMPPSGWVASWPRQFKCSTEKHRNQQGVPSQPARYSLELFPYGSRLGQTKSPKIQFAKKVIEVKRKPSDSPGSPRASGRSAGIRTRGLLDPKIRLKRQGVLSAPFGSVCFSRKCFPAFFTPMPTYAPHTVWVTIWVRPQSQSFEQSAEKHWHYPFRARWRHISSRYSTLVLIRCQ